MKRNINTLRKYYNNELWPICKIEFDQLTDDDLKMIENTGHYAAYAFNDQWQQLKADIKARFELTPTADESDPVLFRMNQAIKRMIFTYKISLAIMVVLIVLHVIKLLTN
jgi:hypothetical protein